MKVGRKSAYDTRIKPYFSEILEMCKTCTDAQIAESLGVSSSTFFKYKSEIPEFSELLKKGRKNLVTELRGILIKKAKGYDYIEKKTTYKNGIEVQSEVYTKHSPPDVAALNLLLKNYDADNWANDPQALKLKEKELELREKQIEQNNW